MIYIIHENHDTISKGHMTGTLLIKFDKYLQGTNANINLHPTVCAHVQGWQQLVPGLVW